MRRVCVNPVAAYWYGGRGWVRGVAGIERGHRHAAAEAAVGLARCTPMAACRCGGRGGLMGGGPLPIRGGGAVPSAARCSGDAMCPDSRLLIWRLGHNNRPAAAGPFRPRVPPPLRAKAARVPRSHDGWDRCGQRGSMRGRQGARGDPPTTAGRHRAELSGADQTPPRVARERGPGSPCRSGRSRPQEEWAVLQWTGPHGCAAEYCAGQGAYVRWAVRPRYQGRIWALWP